VRQLNVNGDSLCQSDPSECGIDGREELGAIAIVLIRDTAMPILSGCASEASRLHTTAATTTAAGPFGQAVANHKAEVMPTASAERIPITTAAIKSNQGL